MPNRMTLETPVGLGVEADRDWLELSLAQQAVWLDARVSGSSAFQLGGWARIDAPLDEDAVKQAVSLIMARHDGLRLRVDDELPRQWLDDSVEPPMTTLELFCEGDPDAAFRAHVDEVFASPLPMGDRPLFEIRLIRAGVRRNYLLWRFHHLIADSASVSITLNHWFAAYDALTSGTPGELAPRSSYLPAIASDSAYPESAAYHQDLAYWTGRFDPLPEPLIEGLETRRALSSPRAASAGWAIEGDAFARFEKAAQAAGTSAQRALFALCTVGLGRRYGKTDIVSGIALHRRDLANRHTIGMLAGVIPVRCQFETWWSLEECVQEFSEKTDADLRHQRLPVDHLSRALALSGTGRAGLFEVAMSFIPAERGQARSGIEGLPVTTGAVETKEASPVSIHAAERAGGKGISVRVAVNPDYLDATEAGTLALLVQSAIEKFIGSPGSRFEELTPLTDGERALVVEEWNQTGAAFEQGTLDGLFAEQVKRTPDALAVVGRDGAALTYTELDIASTRLARRLAAQGIAPGHVVGVRMERSAETIVALLAILKAGAVYLPLDPAYPPERLDYMAKDAGAVLVLESPDLDIAGAEGDADLPVLTDPRRLAYIIYTSGTTGQPKGVAVAHSAAVNLAFARRACHDPIGLGDRVLAAISVGFDVSIGQLLLPLLSGAAVVIAGDVKTMGAPEFWALLRRERVTHMNSVPSFVDSILHAAPGNGPLALKRLMLGGEALSGALVMRIERALPGVEVVNMYGPTEACIDATFHVATPEDRSAAVLPIGRPLSNYMAYVLDEQRDPVGIGIAGELYLGGAGLANGYLNAPELTAERFVPDIFSLNPDAKMYRTGDRARWRADGRIEFLGRVDRQVKIRGFRVEPGEIAHALMGHPDVNQAVVVVRSERLVAYIVPRLPSEAPEAADLRAFLALSLPDYMVPSAFVAIAAIPLNRNGKLDEDALPAPELREAAHVAPRTSAEELVAGLFAEVLGLDRCGAADNFFELGGHSLLATSLVSKLRSQGFGIPLRAVFETPTVEMLARRIDSCLPRVAGETIAPQVRPAEIPLSFPQERIWFVDRLQQDSSYNIPIAFELRGHLDIAAAERALRRIVERHEVLRTRIVLRNGRPVQEVSETVQLRFPRIELGEPELASYLNGFVRHRFDLAAGLPFECCLAKLAPERHVLAAVIHHVAFDGWSAGVFLSEFAALYTAFTQGSPDPLPPPAVQYADFALWQRAQNREADLAYWMEELRGAPALLELPARMTPAGDELAASDSVPITIAAELHAALLKLAQERGASLFMVLHAAFAVLLSRWSGQDDVVIGTVVANRNRSELESAIGCFVNTLPLRTRFEAGEPFARLLSRVKTTDLAAYAHQDLAFEQLVEALHPERSLRHTPVFQVMLVLQNAPMPVAPLPGLVLRPVALQAEAAKFDLTLSLAEHAGELAGLFEFAAARFEAETVRTLGRQFVRLLEAVARDAGQNAMRIPLLDPAERALVVEEWNRTEAYFERGTLDGLFAKQARLTPEAVAVIGADGTELSYAELDRRATHLARRLAAQGVGRGSVVGVHMQRSAETVVALLAILKAGGVYLPLDPAYPRDRVEYMIQDAGACLLLESIDSFDAEADLPVLTDPERLAYIIYTSGTSGRPKGVAVTHAPAVNLAFARRACHDPIGPGDRILAAISVGFDVSIGQLLLPLLSGATVVIAPDLKTLGTPEFQAFLHQRRVTHINSVPSFFDSILEAAPHWHTPSLRRLMLGGEVFTTALLARLQAKLPGVEIVNIYGPTEACIEATFHIATKADLSSPMLPIGKPHSNYKAWVLDAYLEPVGVGISGELYLGGAGLARGYVNAPELTTERFPADPFSGIPGARMYRTGDRARRRADGSIEFLGRVDEQVKIRGFRVEPGEVEAQLRKQPGVCDAAVIAAQSGNDTRLIAYFTGDGATAIEDLRTGMSSSLPDYMVPSAFVRLETLPLTANGKLDRKALPAPGQDAFVSRPFEAPLGETEAKMAEVWAALLKLDRVGRHDNFFELGGHSLLAVTLIERMQQLGLPGDVRALFSTPTIASLAALGAGPASSAAPMNGIAPDCRAIAPEMLPLIALTEEQIDRIVASVPGGAENVQDIYPLSPLQEGILFQYLMTRQGDPYLTPFLMGFDSRSRLDGFLRALEQVVQRHDVLRTAVVWKDMEQTAQVVLRKASVPVEEFTGTREQLMARFDPRVYRLDLSQAPMLRAVTACDPATGRWMLLLLTHHLTLDHTSMEILVHELRTLMAHPYAALAPSLPYRNFIAQTRAGVSTAKHEAFFTRLLGSVDTPTAPFGLLNIQADSERTIESRMTIDGALSSRIRERARQLGVTPASVFHLAWAAVLGHVSGKSDVVFGTVLFGRMQSGAGSDRVVGMFINTLPIRVELNATTAREGILQTHRTLAELMVHEHAALALAQRCSGVAAPAPLFSALFNYRYSAEAGAEAAWPGVELLHASERTNYPLAMAVDDTGASFLLTALGQPDAHPDRVCRYLETALHSLMDDVPARSVNVLPAAERELVLRAWNKTGAVFESKTLDAAFAEQVRRTPSALAVIGRDGEEVGYSELDARSTRLARWLCAQGVRAEQVVGVRMERSAETIVALLAILKAGGVYLPLDPAYPPDRLDYMAEDAGAVMVLESIDGLTGEAELPQQTEPERLAYIIYTSGTTGRPKGVAVPHKAAVNLAFARVACHDPIGPGDRVLAAISVGFDVSIGQLLLPLLSGAAVVVAPDVKTMDATEFWGFLAQRGVTHINSVPSFFDSILDSAPDAGSLALKRLMLGGEALSGALVARIQSRLPGIEVVNMYGPTEACIDATFHIATTADLASAVLPIGKPLSNYRAYVLNTHLQPAGVGVPGELYLAGAGLARGYVNAPELTGERFPADPFSTVAGERMYRTGDRTKWRDDGSLEFLGRADKQVKIRGFRVEPGEVEAQLRKLPGVREAAVIAQTSAGSVRLIAYYTGGDDTGPEELRPGMAAALPDYMVPAAFVRLERLPLTPNGKLDRKALPLPSFELRSFEPPEGEVENRMAALWAELLKLDRVGRHDNFFELGGHSLLAVTLMERMHRQGLPGDVRALFTTPTIASLAKAAAAPQSPAPVNLAKLTQAQIDRIAESAPGGAANIQDIYPLAPLQEGILFQHLVTSEGDPYLTPFVLAFDTRDRLDRFVQALDLVIARHDVLRTFMVWKDVDEPVQVVLRKASAPVEEVTLNTQGPDAAAQLMERFHPRAYRIDLGQAPLLRVFTAHDTLHGGGRDRWLLMMLTHHLVLDHTSTEILVRELATLMENPRAPLPTPLPYRNFVAETRAGASRREHEEFFTNLLGDVDEPTAPFGLPGNQSNSAEIREGKALLDSRLSRRIREQARAYAVTPASLFHLAWAAVLGHVSSKTDVVFGTVLFGRMRSGEGADRVVGMFINTLPIRLQLNENGVAESLRQTHHLLAQLMAHEHAPLALAQRCSAVPAPAPLFSSLFNFRHSPVDESADGSPNAGVEIVDSFERTNYPLSMAVDDRGSNFLLSALGQPEAHPHRVCEYLANAVSGLVELLEQSPRTPVRTIQVIPAAERALLIDGWNRTHTEFPAGTLDGLFTEQCRRTPDALAVVDPDGASLTYAELDAQSTRLSRWLAAEGVRPERVVGVRMPRSADTIVCFLAILKAGGVYLPLDPAYPRERLDYMAKDAGAMLVLDSVPGLSGDSDLPRFTDPDRLAYIIYTSGTSGQPKGVAVTHAPAVNMAFARRAGHDPIGPGDHVLAAISVGFDVSIGQLLLPLLSGATVVIAPDVKTMGAGEFWSLLSSKQVTHINSVPSFIDSILDAAPSPERLSLRRLMLGGEALSGALVARIKGVLPGVEVVNMYGPTETCIDATFHVATTADLSAAVLPIGRPLSNYRAYVLDSQLEPAGIGVAGELFLGGRGLARGYVNADALTAERFVNDPFSPEPGARMYKTGDRCRRRADGSIEFLGRADQQVKIRGFRVEPGEIANALLAHPALAQAVVVPRAGRLIAYLVPGAGCDAPSTPDLRAFLSQRLPDYMVPAAFVQIPAIPLTRNGKLDIGALPRDAGQTDTRVYEPPRGARELALQRIWQSILAVEPVGRKDHFFELGGDSLSALRLVNRINAEFQADLPMRALFDSPTIEALAAALESCATPRARTRLVPLQRHGTKPRLFCIHPAGGHVFCYLPLVKELGPDQPVFGLQASGLEAGEPLSASIEEMASEYLASIREVQPEGPYHLLGMSSGGLIAFEMARQIKEHGGEAGFLGLLDTSVPDPDAAARFTEESTLTAIAGELGCADLMPLPNLAALVETAHADQRLPPGFTLEHAERIAAVFRNNVARHLEYGPRPWDGPLLLVRALRRWREGDVPPDWSRLCPGVKSVDLDCGHMEILSPAFAPALAAVIMAQR